MKHDSMIIARNLVKIYKVAGLEVVALQGLDLTVPAGEFLALVGPSGSGKSTLLSMLAGMERPSAGELQVGNENILAYTRTELTHYRRSIVGIVWQHTGRNLLPYLSIYQNITMLAQLHGMDAPARHAWAMELLTAVGMHELADRKPATLSGGQQQRVALACALANRPQLLLADEPTGELDWANAEQTLVLLQRVRTIYGLTIVLVTHDPRVAQHADRILAIRDGRSSSERTAATGNQERLVVDAAGRLQLAAEQRAQAGIGQRVAVDIVDGGLLVRPLAGMTDEAYPDTIADDAPPPPKSAWWKRE